MRTNDTRDINYFLKEMHEALGVITEKLNEEASKLWNVSIKDKFIILEQYFKAFQVIT